MALEWESEWGFEMSGFSEAFWAVRRVMVWGKTLWRPYDSLGELTVESNHLLPSKPHFHVTCHP